MTKKQQKSFVSSKSGPASGREASPPRKPSASSDSPFSPHRAHRMAAATRRKKLNQSSPPASGFLILSEYHPKLQKFVNVPIFSQSIEPAFGTIIVCQDGYYFAYDPTCCVDVDFAGIYLRNHKLRLTGKFPRCEVVGPLDEALRAGLLSQIEFVDDTGTGNSDFTVPTVSPTSELLD